MKNSVLKIVASVIAFFLAYIGISYLLNGKVDWESAIFCGCGYAIGFTLVSIFSKKKKAK